MKLLPFFAAFLLFLTACSHISGRIEAPAAPQKTGEFRAGTNRIDITPPPGFVTGGHSIGGAVARGFWTRLHARALYLEDSSGKGLAMVSCDLWSIPAGLADRVADLVNETPVGKHLGREDFLIAATHTHHSPGNYSSSPAYNTLPSRTAGFDEELFNFLAARIATSVVSAITNARPATLQYRSALVPNFTRNRSFEAFLLNPESSSFIASSAAQGLRPVPEPPPLFPHAKSSQAVAPRLRILSIHSQTNLIGAAIFFPCHPTVMPNHTELLHSDIFGFAATRVEQSLRLPQGASPVIAMFNGAEGDVSAMWREQGRSETVRLGEELAQSILNLLNQPAQSWTGSIAARFETVKIADRYFTDHSGRDRRTADVPLPGAAVLGGAEDGRPFLYHLGWKEGVRAPFNPREPRQGSKQPAFDPPVELPLIPRDITRTVAKLLDAPKRNSAGRSHHRSGSVCDPPRRVHNDHGPAH